MDDDAFTVVAVASVVAESLLGWSFAARLTRAGGSAWAQPKSDRSWRMAFIAAVIVGSGAAANQAPVNAVFWLLAPLNLLLGPRGQRSVLDLPDVLQACRHRIGPALRRRGRQPDTGSTDGHQPRTPRRSASTPRAACARGITELDEAPRAAAEVLAADLEAHRRPGSRWANTCIAISLVEYSLESGALETAHTTLLETRPS